jgi:flavin-dependent dehydrogenase
VDQHSAPAASGALHGNHAIVVGGGFSGLLAARVLSDHFRRVSVLDQDELADGTEYRSGVPQSRHGHTMLTRGARIIEELFPGLQTELAALGAPIFDLGEFSQIIMPCGWIPRVRLGISIQTFTRPTLEKCIRRRVMARRGVCFRKLYVEGLCWDRTAKRVAGVRIRSREANPSSPVSHSMTMEGDLVVIANGQTSKLTAWLTEAGFPSPGERVINGHLAYSSRIYRIPPGTETTWHLTLEMPHPPSAQRGGGVSHVDGERWLVTLLGAGGEVPPGDELGFAAWAASLRNPHIGAVIASGKPDGAIYRLVKFSNRWTLYHRMPRWPERLLCVGDAVCALNPIYGQGMTISAIQAKLMQNLLEERHPDAGLAELGHRFQRRAARVLRTPWIMATSADRAWDPAHVPRAVQFAQWYMNLLFQLIPSDLDTYRRFWNTTQMVTSPATLFHPLVLGKIAKSAFLSKWSRRTRPLSKKSASW